jgi:hypothetical protein
MEKNTTWHPALRQAQWPEPGTRNMALKQINQFNLTSFLMIRHIVLFKLKTFENEHDKLRAAEIVREQLDLLPAKIPFIKSFSSGIDFRKLPHSFDIGICMDFASREDLESYTIHPAHQAFIQFNKEYSVDKVCIDYEL